MLKCEKCFGTEFVKCGTRTRTMIDPDGEKYTDKVQRVKCKNCGQTKTLYDDYILPYKRYEKPTVEGLADGSIQEDDPLYQGPSSRSIRRWRKKHVLK